MGHQVMFSLLFISLCFICDCLPLFSFFSAPGCQREIKDKIPINAVVLHPNQAELFVGYQDGTVRVFDLSMANKPIKEAIPEDDTAIRSLSVSPDGSLLCAVNNSVSTFHSSFILNFLHSSNQNDLFDHII
jgi:WD40 repeat protein